VTNRQPDLERLLLDAYANPVRIPIGWAKEVLGNLLDDEELSEETLIIRAGEPVALTATTWIRIVRRAMERVCGRPQKNRRGFDSE
jgi:hypothetical protein